jgi:hypothetical protein
VRSSGGEQVAAKNCKNAPTPKEVGCNPEEYKISKKPFLAACEEERKEPIS